MEQYNEDTSKLLNAYTKTRSWIVNFLGIIVTVIGVIVVFVVSSLEGTKEIIASNTINSRIIQIYRSDNPGSLFPEPKTSIIVYDNQEYYFVVDEYGENGEILDWYFAYDGGLEYIFNDYKFYVLTALTIVISMWVSSINYTSTSRAVMQGEQFVKTLGVYAERKKDIDKYTQYIPDFCMYKNQQAYEMAKREIVEEASIHWESYNSPNFDVGTLQKWQKKTLKKIRKIKVKKIYSNDLLQENGQSVGRIQLLPMSQQEHKRIFFVTGGFQKVISSALSGLVVAFGVVLGNWVLGITYGLTVIMSFVSAIIIATDFVSTTLRNRYLAKADLLREFDNIKEMFEKKEEVVKEEVKEVKIEEPKEVEEKATIMLPMVEKMI
jgi:acid phosphatase family membrane protein YuiD